MPNKKLFDYASLAQFMGHGYGLEKFEVPEELSAFAPRALIKKQNGYEITVEFCIGDHCVGVFDEELSIMEPKFRAKNLAEAFKAAMKFEKKYFNNSKP